jgi:hypothetical protein
MSDKTYTVNLTESQLIAIGVLAGSRALELEKQPIRMNIPNVRAAYDEYVNLVILCDSIIPKDGA